MRASAQAESWRTGVGVGRLRGGESRHPGAVLTASSLTPVFGRTATMGSCRVPPNRRVSASGPGQRERRANQPVWQILQFLRQRVVIGRPEFQREGDAAHAINLIYQLLLARLISCGNRGVCARVMALPPAGRQHDTREVLRRCSLRQQISETLWVATQRLIITRLIITRRVAVLFPD